MIVITKVCTLLFQKAYCVDQWLAVTVESECMPGEGLIFQRHGNATCFLGNVIKPG